MKKVAFLLQNLFFLFIFACQSTDPAVVQKIETTAQNFKPDQDSLQKLNALIREFKIRQDIPNIGGMTAQVPTPGQPAPNQEAVELYLAMKERVPMMQADLDVRIAEQKTMVEDYKNGKIKKEALDAWLQKTADQEAMLARFMLSIQLRMADINARTGK